MNLIELREKLGEAYNYAIEEAVNGDKDKYSSYYAGKAEAFLYVIGSLDSILSEEGSLSTLRGTIKSLEDIEEKITRKKARAI